MRTKKGIVVKANEFLEYSYMKRAAEGGLVEAQHNLGVMYQEGAVILEQGKKTIDEFRSLTWYHLITNFRYIKAATRGYAESAVNAI